MPTQLGAPSFGHTAGDPYGSIGASSSPVVTDTDGASGARGGSRPQAGDPPAPGLVLFETKETWKPHNAWVQRKRRLLHMRRALGTAAQQIQTRMGEGGRRVHCAMVTLTYAQDGAWKPRHMNELVDRVRKYYRRKGVQFAYVWVAELTERGRVHYHLLVFLPKGVAMPKPDKQGWWKHGSTRVEWARKAVGYITKYASKGGEVEKMPLGLRLHGRGGLTDTERVTVRWWVAPRYVRDFFGPAIRVVRRRVGGGWEDDRGCYRPGWTLQDSIDQERASYFLECERAERQMDEAIASSELSGAAA